ncbi:MAG: hypothetical protein JWQ87_143 [Candidatus Sulfotelmatobacter sp.]|nr:hypothetical protein [Candidatus Sulfotelmatobacter sp.]
MMCFGNMAEAYRVFVVLDRNYGERVAVLAQTGPVWIVDTPLNRAAAQKLWADDPNHDHLDGVTTFKFAEDSSPEDILINELDTVDVHHGIYSANPPYTVIEAIGVSISEKLRSKLSQFGFNQFEATPQGFHAVRPLPSDWSPDRW